MCGDVVQALGARHVTVWLGMLVLISITAEFQGTIGTTIPQIIDLLKHNDSHARAGGAQALSKLSEQGV